MSDSFKFSNNTSDPIARLEHIESTLPNLARLSEFFSFKEQLENLCHEFKKEKMINFQTSERLDKIELNLSDIQKSICGIISGIKKYQIEVDEKINSLSQHKTDISDRLDSAFGSISFYSKQINDILVAFENYQKNHVSKKDLQISNSYIFQIKSRIESVENLINSLNKQSQFFKDSVESVTSFYESLNSIVKDVISESKNIEKSCKSYIDTSIKNTSQKILDLHQEMTIKFAALPSPPIPLKMDEVKEEVKKIVEPFFLDAKNAALKSNNSDMRVSLMEKKVEQVMLIAKKLEIQA